MISVVLPFLINNNNNNDSYKEEVNNLIISINSIIKQTYQEWELVIVDDGSNNKDIDIIIESFQARDSRIKYYKNITNLGITQTLNYSITNYCSNSSKYIARMDSDDISHSKRLELQFKYMESNSDIDILGCPVKMFNNEKLNQILNNSSNNNNNNNSIDNNNNNNSIDNNNSSRTCLNNSSKDIYSTDYVEKIYNLISNENEFKFIQHPDKDLANWSMFFNCCLVHPSVIVKKSIFNQFKYSSRYKYIEDYELWLDCIVNGNLKVSNIQSNTPLLLLRKHSNSISSKNIDQQRESTALASTYYLEQLLEKNHIGSGIGSGSLNIPLDVNVVKFLINPSKFISNNSNSLSINIFECSIKYLEVIESIFINQDNQKYSTNIKDATNERIGEIASLCLNKYPNSKESESIWKKWLSRNPTSQLLSLLSNLKISQNNNSSSISNSNNNSINNNNQLLNLLSNINNNSNNNNNNNSGSNNKLINNNNKYKDNGIRIICFSKDRAFQLREYLRTFYKYLVNDNDQDFKIQVLVLYTYSNLKFKHSYDLVEKEFSNVRFIKEENFTDQLIQVSFQSNTMKFTLYSVDDILYYNQFNLSNYCGILERESTSSLGFYMKMGSNITYCHTANENIPIPSSLKELLDQDNKTKYLKWNRVDSDCKCDWNYPFDLCSTIYKTQDIDSILNGIIKYYGIRNGINHPNRLEFNGNRTIIQKQCYSSKQFCLSPTTPVMSVITINRVQDVYDNPIYDQTLSLEDLDQLLEQDNQLDDTQYFNNSIHFNSVHIGNLYLKNK